MTAFFNNAKVQQISAWLKKFVYSNYFFLAVGLLTLIGHLFALELVIIAIVSLFCAGYVFLCDDIQPIIVPLLLIMHVVSVKNGAGYYESYDTMLSPLYIGVICGFGSIFLLAFAYYIVKNRKLIKQNYKSNVLLLGMILMGVALIFNGINIYALSPTLVQMGFGTPYSFTTTSFGLLLWAGIFGIFLCVYCFFRHESLDIIYFAKACLSVGLLVSVQLIIRYITCAIEGTLFIAGTSQVDVNAISVGWGVPNVAGMKLLISLPMVFFLTIKQKHTALYFSMAVLISACIIFTVSRNAILFMIPTWIVGLIFMIKLAPNKKQLFISLGVTVGIAIIIVGVFHKQIFALLGRLLDGFISSGDGDFADNGRFILWKNGLEIFAKNPIFGAGFLVPTLGEGHEYATLQSNMYHNMFIQMLGSCGIVGIIALYQHLKDFGALFKKLTLTRAFLLFTALLPLLLTLLDNCIFLTPCGIWYGILLAYAQIEYDKQFVKKDDNTTNEVTDNNEITLAKA